MLNRAKLSYILSFAAYFILVMVAVYQHNNGVSAWRQNIVLAGIMLSMVGIAVSVLQTVVHSDEMLRQMKLESIGLGFMLSVPIVLGIGILQLFELLPTFEWTYAALIMGAGAFFGRIINARRYK